MNKLSEQLSVIIDEMGASLDYITSESSAASKQVKGLNDQYSQLIQQGDQHIEGTSNLLEKQKLAKLIISVTII